MVRTRSDIRAGLEGTPASRRPPYRRGRGRSTAAARFPVPRPGSKLVPCPRGRKAMRFSIGEMVVDVVVDDDDFELPFGPVPAGARPGGAERAARLLEPDFVDLARNVLKCAIQTFILRLAGRTILVDTCIGEHKDRPEIPAWNQRSGSGFLDRLRRAGVDPAAVDTVFCTHLHIDHVGWNRQRADGRWAPISPTPAIWSAAPSRPTGWPGATRAPRRRCTSAAWRTASCPSWRRAWWTWSTRVKSWPGGWSHSPARAHHRSDGVTHRPPGRPRHFLRRRGAQPGADLPAGHLDLVLHRSGRRRRDSADPARGSRSDRPAGGARAFPRPAQDVCTRHRRRFRPDLRGCVGIKSSRPDRIESRQQRRVLHDLHGLLGDIETL